MSGGSGRQICRRGLAELRMAGVVSGALLAATGAAAVKRSGARAQSGTEYARCSLAVEIDRGVT